MLELENTFKFKWLIISFCCTVTVVFITHIPQKYMPNQLDVIGIDKLGHILAYGIITLLFIFSLKSSLSLFSIMIIFFAIACLGIVDELTQPFVNRTASILDWLGDIIGIATVLFSCLYFQKFKKSLA